MHQYRNTLIIQPICQCWLQLLFTQTAFHIIIRYD